ncbi:hypothetical protein CJF32_00001323 [Rutstroemia sp. NJR-2017a WRK4]|nr:hypothetical protein CJF32_00001323 [Rutstroemia sp. NJR-2017a WRK4]
MAAITHVDRDVTHQLIKRGNWAAQEAGVVVVFVIVFIVATGLIGVWLSRFISRRRAASAARSNV